jgi:hypothetical protein
MTARVLSSSPTPEKYFRADSCRCLRATSANRN